MSVRTVAIWTCESCGEEAEAADADAVPKDWRRLIVWAGHRGPELANAVVCGGCVGKVVETLGMELASTFDLTDAVQAPEISPSGFRP